VRVRLVLERQRRQPQPGRPALGAGLEQGHVVLGQPRVATVTGQQVGHLAGGERQVGRAQLRELPTEPQPLERQRRVGPGRHHQPQLLRGVA
jgi:hypothetical protein